MTLETWWETVDNHWDDLFALIHKYHPSERRVINRHTITALRAEEHSQRVREKIKETVKDPCGLASEAKQKRDAIVLRKIFSDVWWGMPESISVRREPGFHQLCSLCEEIEHACPD